MDGTRNGLTCCLQLHFRPKGKDLGEDSCSFNVEQDDIQTYAVFDGCGGAGAWKYPEYQNSTGAYVSAQVVANVYKLWFERQTASAFNKPEEMRNDLLETISSAMSILKQRSSKIGVSGSLIKAFPCTMSAAVITPASDNTLLLTALNAGDSRVYFMTPGNGLIQFTKDDVRGNADALANLRASAPMSNMINADKPFRIDCRQLRLRKPFIVMCMTDGVYGYLRSPMDLEYLFLKTLMESKVPDECEKSFGDYIISKTGDDSSVYIAFYGWDHYKDIQRDMMPRFSKVSEMIRQMDEVSGNLEQFEEKLQEIWQRYKPETVYDEMQRQNK